MSSEELFERCEISGLRGVDESVDESLLLDGADLPATFAGETHAGTGDELPQLRGFFRIDRSGGNGFLVINTVGGDVTQDSASTSSRD